MDTIKRDLIQDAIDLANVDDAKIRDSYSGRGMYGEKCFGVVFDNPRDQLPFIAAVTAVLIANVTLDDESGEGGQDIALRLAGDACFDDMGLGMIVYFPGWTLED